MTADTAWMTRAACAGLPIEMFFPDLGSRGTTGLKVCARCPVRAECLNDDLRNQPFHQHGIRGGMTEKQRRRFYRTRQRRARERAA